MLEEKCSKLEAIIMRVKTTANLVLGLSVAISIINFFIVLGGVLIGCGCENSNSNKIWSVVSCVLACLVMIASIVIAIIGFKNEKRQNIANSKYINKISIILITVSYVICIIGLVVSIFA